MVIKPVSKRKKSRYITAVDGEKPDGTRIAEVIPVAGSARGSRSPPNRDIAAVYPV